MENDRQLVLETADFIAKKIIGRPSIGIVTGTGFLDTPDDLNVVKALDYSQLPNFPIPTVESHKGRLIFGSIEEKQILEADLRLYWHNIEKISML